VGVRGLHVRGMSKSNTNERPKSRAARSAWYASIIEEQERDGISVTEAAQAAGITAVTLYRWKKLLSSQCLLDPSPTQGLVRVQVEAAESRQALSANSMLLHLRQDRSIVVALGFDSGELTRLIEVCEAC